MFLYSLLIAAALVLGSPYWLYRMALGGRYRAGLGERLGRVPPHLRAIAKARPVIWVHAVSVGEVLAAVRLIAEMEAALPGYVIVLSTTTKTGQDLAAKRLGAGRVFYFPLDFRFAVRRYLGALVPRMLVLMESELWPRMLVECAERGVPVAVVNARVSDRSFPRYLWLKRLWRPLLAKVTLFLAQDEEHARRLLEVGAPMGRVHITGNLKYDVAAAPRTELVDALARTLAAGTKLVVAGSTLEGEETALLQAWTEVAAAVPEGRLLLAPRHPQRFQAAADQIAGAGFAVVRLSELREPQPLAPNCVLLLDTIGDLAAAYSLAALAFVGGSLVDAGGHNPLEPAQFGVPVVMGESFENFREIVQAMQAADAVRIVSSAMLSGALIELLLNDVEARAMGERGRDVFAAQAGATVRTVHSLLALVKVAV